MLRLCGVLWLALLVLCGHACLGQTYRITQERNGLVNVLARMQAGAPTTIAYFGGSITAGAGASDSSKTSLRALTTAWFRRQFPKSTITEIDASIGGTGSDFGAFRLQRDVLDKKPDLVFVEFAVNDGGALTATINRAIEGVVRHIRMADPTTEICFLYTLSQEMLADYKQGKLPGAVFLHDVVAAHYHISSVNVGAAEAQLIEAGKLTWAEFSRDSCHPTDAGYAHYADTLTAFLADQLLHISRPPVPYRLLEPLFMNSWDTGNLTTAVSLPPMFKGWKTVSSGSGSGGQDAVESNSSTADPIEFAFKGDTVGITFLLGPDTGNFEYKIDAAEWLPVHPFDVFALQGPRIQYRILADSLQNGAHTIAVRPRNDKDDRSKGQYTRIISFMTCASGRP